MGKNCPICGAYSPIRRNITHDSRPAIKASDVIASELACGHRVGGEDFMKYEAARKTILAEQVEKVNAIENETKNKLGTLLSSHFRKPVSG